MPPVPTRGQQVRTDPLAFERSHGNRLVKHRRERCFEKGVSLSVRFEQPLDVLAQLAAADACVGEIAPAL